MKTMYVLFLIIFLSGCAVQNEFFVTEAGKKPIETIESYYYALPHTVIGGSITIERELFIPGPYNRFAERYLGMNQVKGEQNIRYEIGSVHLEYFAEPDPEKYFSINVVKGSFAPSEYLRLTQHGLVLDPSGWKQQSSGYKDGLSDPDPPFFTDLSVTGFFTEVTDTLYKTIVTDTSFIRLPIPRRQREVKTLEQRAQEAAEFILEIRRARFELIAGEIDGFPSGEALGFAVKELNRLESEYLELFTGKKVRDLKRKTFFIIPEGNTQEIVLFKINEKLGLLEASNPGGVPVLLSVQPLNNLRNIELTETADQEFNKNLVYRIPDIAMITVSKGNDVYYEGRVSLYQAGKMVKLPVK